jgi:hypothetical protein
MSNQRRFRVISRRVHAALVTLGLRRPRAAIHPLTVLAAGALIGVGAGLAIPPAIRGRIAHIVRQSLPSSLLGRSASGQALLGQALTDDAEGEGNEGEGSRTAARRYDRATTAFAKSGKVPAAAAAARRAIEGPEGEQLRQAEEDAKRNGFS